MGQRREDKLVRIEPDPGVGFQGSEIIQPDR
jgi:hypothetical protein